MRSEASWTEFTIAAPASLEDDLAAALCEAGATGVRVDSPPRDQDGGDGGASSSQPGSAVVLSAFFDSASRPPTPDDLRDLLAGAAGAEAASVRLVSVASVVDGRWAERWIEALAPFDVGRRFTIVPVPDLRGPAAAGERNLAAGRIPMRICPSRAFGTGEHPTTRLCLEALEDLPISGRSLLDAGTGSGILAVAGVLLGAGRVVAVDEDPEAVEVARANADLNGCLARISFVSVAAESLEGDRFDVVVANLNGAILERVLPRLVSRLAEDGRVILSGLRGSEAQPIAALGETSGLRRLAAEHREGWACVVLGAARA